MLTAQSKAGREHKANSRPAAKATTMPMTFLNHTRKTKSTARGIVSDCTKGSGRATDRWRSHGIGGASLQSQSTEPRGSGHAVRHALSQEWVRVLSCESDGCAALLRVSDLLNRHEVADACRVTTLGQDTESTARLRRS